MQVLPFALLETGDPRQVLLDLAMLFVLARLLTWHYVHFSPVLANKAWLARALPILAATTMLVSFIVQMSVLVSLGFVGALTLMRFRTPIKEPEEMAYLFLAIALGLGMGADEWLLTSLVLLAVLVYMSVVDRLVWSDPARILVRVSGELGESSAEEALGVLLGEPSAAVDLRRVETRGTEFSATFLVDEGDERLAALTARSRKTFPAGTIDVVRESELA